MLGRVLSQGGDAGHTGVFPTPHCTNLTCTLLSSPTPPTPCLPTHLSPQGPPSSDSEDDSLDAGRKRGVTAMPGVIPGQRL